MSTAGTFRLFNKQMFLSHALADEYVGLEEIDDGLWNILFYRTLLGRFDQATNVISGADFRTSKA